MPGARRNGCVAENTGAGEGQQSGGDRQQPEQIIDKSNDGQVEPSWKAAGRLEPHGRDTPTRLGGHKRCVGGTGALRRRQGASDCRSGKDKRCAGARLLPAGRHRGHHLGSDTGVCGCTSASALPVKVSSSPVVTESAIVTSCLSAVLFRSPPRLPAWVRRH